MKVKLFGLMVLLLIGMAMADTSNETNVTAAVQQVQPLIRVSDFNFASIMLWVAGFCLLLPFGWFIGRIQDLNQRCKWMVFLTKKDYRLVKFKYPGSIRLYSKIIDVGMENYTFNIGSKKWILLKKRMFIEGNEKQGIDIRKLDENPGYDDGCPVIFVDAEHATPLAFVGDDLSVNPEELGSIMNGFFLNQLAKALLSVKNIKNILMVIVAIAALCLVFTYLNHIDNATMQTNMTAINGKLDMIELQINATGHFGQSSNPPVITSGIKAGG